MMRTILLSFGILTAACRIAAAQTEENRVHAIFQSPFDEAYIQFDTPDRMVRDHLTKATSVGAPDLRLIAPDQTTKIEVSIPRLHWEKIVDVNLSGGNYFYFKSGIAGVSVEQRNSALK